MKQKARVLIASAYFTCFLAKKKVGNDLSQILIGIYISTECVLCVAEAVCHLGPTTGNKTGLFSQVGC